MNKYIYLRKGKYIVKNDKESILLFYNYFLDKSVLFGYSNLSKNISRFIYNMLNLSIKVLYLPFLFDVFFKTKKLETNFLIKRYGGGNWSSKINLIKDNSGNYKIIKMYKSKKDADKEVSYIDKYKGKNNNFVLPKYKRINENTIEFNFIQDLNLWVKLKLNYIKKNEIINLFEKFSQELNKIYGNKKCLIHGDLFPINIYCIKDKFHIIDFNDSHKYYPDFDRYIFLKNILRVSYGYCDHTILQKYFSKKTIEEFEKHYQMCYLNKHGNTTK
ncbi:MAG: RIO1 family regulatory kinase/ATPase [Candidatus Woesearchaeota archaeon]